jgi:hypothetical protein
MPAGDRLLEIGQPAVLHRATPRRDPTLPDLRGTPAIAHKPGGFSANSTGWRRTGVIFQREIRGRRMPILAVAGSALYRLARRPLAV